MGRPVPRPPTAPLLSRGQTISHMVRVPSKPLTGKAFFTPKTVTQKTILRLALQLHILFDMGALCFGLMRSSPKRPCDDVCGVDASLCETRGDTPDFLYRPSDQWRILPYVGRVGGVGRIVFGGGGALA